MPPQTVIIACPYGYVTGGPELAHQLCHILNNHHINSYMYYYLDNGNYAESETPEPYRYYNTKIFTHEHVHLLTSPDTAFVIPETAVPLGVKYHTSCRIYYWWMSVDNYIAAAKSDLNNSDTLDCYQLLSDTTAIHMVQSEYARRFLLSEMHIPASQIHYLADYINEAFFSIQIPAEYKQDFIAFNPAKGYETLNF